MVGAGQELMHPGKKLGQLSVGPVLVGLQVVDVFQQDDEAVFPRPATSDRGAHRRFELVVIQPTASQAGATSPMV